MDDEIAEVPNNPMDLADEESVVEEEGVKRGRGAPKIPDMWTRVISMSTDNLEDLKTYIIRDELLLN